MKRSVTSIGRLWMLGFVLIASTVMLSMTGCSDDTATSLTNPTAGSFEPTGTIQGIVRDSVTLQPIVGAKVSIGVTTATTDAYGQYILADVPATSDALNGSIADMYRMTVDLRSVTSPVAMATATTGKYPDFVYHDVELNYTSMNDSTPCPDFVPDDADIDSDSNNDLSTCGTNATNHDTPVEGMVASVTTTVGKLDANISGVVAGCDSSGFEDEFFTPVAAGYIVKLYSNSGIVSDSDGNSSSGQDNHLIGQTTTDTAGAFSFSNVEANLNVTITADSTDGTRVDSINNTTPADGLTLALTVQKSTALHVCPNDAHGPEIVAISPEPASDQTPGSTSVAITFSEAVKDTPTASTDASLVGSLYDDIEVNFEGDKAGNVAYSLAWNTARTVLTATFTTGSSSLYTVRITNMDSRFTDDNNVAAAMGICDDDSVVAALTGNPYGVVADAGSTDCTVYFSTGGGATPAATTSLTVTNATSQNVGSTSALLDWPVISGAKSYNVYCRQDQLYQDSTTQAGAMEYVTNVTASTYNLNPSTLVVSGGSAGYIATGNEHGLQYACLVRGYNSDLVEGADSNTVTIKDAVGPSITAASAVISDGDADGNADTVRITFNETLGETSAETASNYVFAVDTGTAPTTTGAVLCSGTLNQPVTGCPATANVVQLTISETQTAAALADNASDLLTVSSVSDVTLNAVLSTGNVYHLSTGTVD